MDLAVPRYLRCTTIPHKVRDTTYHDVSSYDLGVHADGLHKKGLQQGRGRAGGEEPQTHSGHWAWLHGAPTSLRAKLTPGPFFWGGDRLEKSQTKLGATLPRTLPQDTHLPGKKSPGREETATPIAHIHPEARLPDPWTHQEAVTGAWGVRMCHSPTEEVDQRCLTL